VSLDSARAAYDKLTAVLVKVTPGALLALSDSQLKEIGLSRQKISYARNIASALRDKKLELAHLRTLDDDRVRASLTKIKGIGIWTANITCSRLCSAPAVRKWTRSARPGVHTARLGHGCSGITI
jgi:DNA-3-methyladenine glycosylase II